jgi:hypothetical protein
MSRIGSSSTPDLVQLRERRLGDLVAGLEIDLAGLLVDQSWAK